MKLRTGITLLSAAALTQAAAGQTFLNTSGNTLYRTTFSGGSATTETFTLGAQLNSLAIDPVTGAYYGSSAQDIDNDGSWEFFRLDNPLGAAPSVTMIGDFLAENTPSISFANGQLLGFQQVPGSATGGNASLVSIDLNMLTQSTIDSDLGSRHESSGYDPATGTLYAGSSGNGATSAGLWTVPFTDVDVVSQFIGFSGETTQTNGGEFFGGSYYQAITNPQTQDIAVGSFDLGTGVFTELFTIDNDIAGSVGLVIVPAPGAACVLAMAGLTGLRRRR